MSALALIFVPLVVLTPQIFVHTRDVNRSIDFFEMPLEQLMTIEVALARVIIQGRPEVAGYE